MATSLNSTPAARYEIKTVESGYALVVLAETGKTVGYLSRDKVGSTRTGTMWLAASLAKRDLGWSYTRDEAAAIVIAQYDKVVAYQAACAAHREASK